MVLWRGGDGQSAAMKPMTSLPTDVVTCKVIRISARLVSGVPVAPFHEASSQACPMFGGWFRFIAPVMPDARSADHVDAHETILIVSVRISSDGRVALTAPIV